jgi:hypothetical protein
MKLTWKDKLWLVMQGMGFVFLYVGLPLILTIIVLDILFLGQTGFIVETINNFRK